MDRKRGNNVYLIAMPAIIVAIILKVIPLINAFRLPFIEYRPPMGMWGSPHVGFKNFGELFSNVFVKNVVGNTLILNLGSMLLISLIAVLLGLALSTITKKGLKNVFIIIFIIPFFIPTAVFSYICMGILHTRPFSFIPSTEAYLLPENFRLFFIVLESLKISGLLSVVVLAFIEDRRQENPNSLVNALKAAGLFVLIQLTSILSTDVELMQTFYHPIVYQVADTMDTFEYRTGLLNANYGFSAAMWLIKFIIQLPIAIAIYYILRKLFMTQQTKTEDDIAIYEGDNATSKGHELIGTLVCILYALMLLLPFISTAISMGSASTGEGAQLFQNANIPRNYTIYLVLTLFAVFLNFLATITLAYPLTQPRSSGKCFYEIFLLILLTMGQGGIHEYQFYRSLGMINTLYPYVLNGLFSIMSVFVLGSVLARDRECENFHEYFKAIKEPALALAGLQFIAIWNSFYPSQLVYIADNNLYSPTMMFRNIGAPGAGDVKVMFEMAVLQFGLLVSLPSLIVGLLLCIFADKKVFISQIRRG